MFRCARLFETEVKAYNAGVASANIYAQISDMAEMLSRKYEPITNDDIDPTKAVKVKPTFTSLSLGQNGRTVAHHRVSCCGCGAPHAYGVACVYCGGGA